MRTYRATHPCGYGSVRQARRAVAAFAETCGFSDGSLSDVESAVGEALANAAEHGDRITSSGFEVTAMFDEEQLIIEVQDHGAGFDCDPPLKGPPRPAGGNRGFGIFLMRTLMDEVVYSERGSRIQLVKRLA